MSYMPSDDRSDQPFLRRLDRAFSDLNAILLALAIGLALLDFTCFIGMATFSEIRRAEQSALLATQAPPHGRTGADAEFH
jgi:hypothetical protein